ncbi:MAG TPA: hypothetical protein PL009_08055 [Flavipsychrobacter sp.]|nr:hypothetical protein [Flavipsychrobacter sp.]
MKKFLFSAACVTMLFAACKKSDNNSNKSGLGNNQFKVGNTTYSDVFLSSTFGFLSAVSPTGGSLQFRFNQDILPATTGTFKVVVNPDANDEIQIIALSNVGGTTKAYTAGYVSGQNATVTVTGGKFKLQFDNVSARNQLDSTETVPVSANISQD